MKALHVEQSLPICCSLAALGGILEVAATAVTAVPAVREKEGIALRWWVQWLAIAGNVGLQAIGSVLSHLIATWFGPVSLVVPFFYSATLLSNMLIFGLLGERFTKNMRVGTHVIVVANILLPVVGPNIQEGQEISTLLRHWYSIVWFTLLLVACAVTGILLLLDITRYSMRVRTVILLAARAAAISVNLTVSRAFILGLNDAVLGAFIAIKLVSGSIYTYAIVVQSFAVEQARFVPLNATTIIIVNALTGIIIWEDWRVVSSWYGYICIFVLLGLGCDLLLSVPLLTAENPEFGTTKRASMIIRRRSPSARLSNNMIMNEDEQASLHVSTNDHSDYETCSHTSSATPESVDNSAAASSSRNRTSRFDAWKQLLSPIQSQGEIEDCEDEDDDQPQQQQQQQQSPAGWNNVFQTPQKVGNAIKDTTFMMGGKLAKAATTTAAMMVGGNNEEQQEGTQSSSAPPQRLSRIAAWRETVSPIRRLRNNNRYTTYEAYDLAPGHSVVDEPSSPS